MQHEPNPSETAFSVTPPMQPSERFLKVSQLVRGNECHHHLDERLVNAQRPVRLHLDGHCHRQRR